MAEEQEKTVRVAQFLGKDEAEFGSFDAKLKAIGTSKGWHDALIDANCAPKEDQAQVQKKNCCALNALKMTVVP